MIEIPVHNYLMLNSQLTLVLLEKPDCLEYVHFNSLKSLGSSNEVTTEQNCLVLSNVSK